MDALKVLGQSYPTLNVLTDLYTVPAATSSTVSSFTACNQTAGPANFRLAVAPGGASDDPKHYIYYDLYIDANDTFIATVGFSLAAGDVVRVYSNVTGLSFSLFGVEIT